MILQPDEHRSRQLKYRPLEKVGDRALLQCGINHSQLRFVSDTGNVIFRAEAGNRAYSVRIYHEEFKTIPEISGELYWLLDLTKHTNLIVPQPLTTTSGNFVQEVHAPDGEGTFHVVVFHWVPGEIIGANLEVGVARQIGKLMAELHTHAETFELPANSFSGYDRLAGNGTFYSQPRISPALTY